jgi:hypothetical protein
MNRGWQWVSIDLLELIDNALSEYASSHFGSGAVRNPQAAHGSERSGKLGSC